MAEQLTSPNIDMISLRFTIRSAYSSLRANRVRSGLTILGIVIGITAIMLIVSIGGGAQALILDQVGGLGADTIVLRPGRLPKGPTDLAQTLFSDSLKVRDVDALARKENVPDLVSYAPVVFLSEPVSYGGQVTHPSVMGWSAQFMVDATRATFAEGGPFGEDEIKSDAAVAIIGDKARKDLFGDEPANNKFIRIKGKNFRITGVLSPGNAGIFNVDNMVLLPYTTARVYLSGKDNYQEVMLRVGDPANVERSVEDIKRAMRELHNITDPAKDDFYVETQQGAIAQITTILSVLTAFLSAVVAISLVVGGIGVMNVMLVSVTERTREIGLRKAIGARSKDILLQFLFEATLLTLFGGLIGVTLGAMFGFVAAKILAQSLAVDWTYTFPLQATLIGLLVSGGVGLVFGGYPAWKASRKSPIEALRYE